MELDTPLNKAHSQVRKSEKLIRVGKFEEAISLQDRIVELLEEALLDAKDSNVRDSLHLQIEHHKKQKKLIAYKRASWENLCQQLVNLQAKMSNASSSGDGLQDSIFRTFQETESLLEHLRVGTEPNEPSSPGATGAKMPKDDKIIIEELQTANNHLRKMVETMFAELETYKKENSELKARIRDLEAEKKARLAVSGNVEYPGLVTHVTKLELGLEDSGQFPDLAPLEMPQFDFPADNKS